MTKYALNALLAAAYFVIIKQTNKACFGLRSNIALRITFLKRHLWALDTSLRLTKKKSHIS